MYKAQYYILDDIIVCQFKFNRNDSTSYLLHYANFSYEEVYKSYANNETINNDTQERYIQIKLSDYSISGVTLKYIEKTDGGQNNFSAYIPITIMSRENYYNKENQKITTLFAIISLSFVSVIIAVNNLKDIIRD